MGTLKDENILGDIEHPWDMQKVEPEEALSFEDAFGVFHRDIVKGVGGTTVRA